MMKKTRNRLIVILIAVSLSFTACGVTSSFDDPVNETTIQAETEVSETIEVTEATEVLEESDVTDLINSIPETDPEMFITKYDAAVGGLIVTGYKGRSTRDRIPVEIDGDKVSQVSFDGEKNIIKTLVIPEGVELVKACSSLETVVLPESQTVIYDNCFAFELYGNHGCMLESIYAPNIEEIGDYAFLDCTNLKSVSFPNATKMGYEAFSGCSNLKSVDLPKITVIPIGAFSDSALEEYDFSNVEYIQSGAFFQCNNMQSVDLSNCKIIGSRAFQLNENLCEIKLSDNLEYLGAYCFSSCASLTEIDVPYCVIGDGAFSRCDNLLTATFRTTGRCMFAGCRSLKEAFFICDENETYITSSMIIDGAYLASWSYGRWEIGWQPVEMDPGSSLCCIAGGSFGYCISLKEFKLVDWNNNDAIYVGGVAFSNCNNLRMIDFGDNIIYIYVKEPPFDGCDALTVIYDGEEYNHTNFGDLYSICSLS